MIESIGMVDEVPLLITSDANRQRRIELNQTADANRRVDISVDLTHLLKNDDVAYEETGFDTGPDTGYTMVEILLPNTLDINNANYLNVGSVELWKIDALFTTIGIR